MNAKIVFYNTDILRHIVSYIVFPKYELLDWINELFEKYFDKNDKTNYFAQLYKYNMNNYIESIEYLTKNYENIDWEYLSENIYAIDILKNNIDKVDWSKLSKNKNSINLLQNNIDKIDWFNIIYNDNAINIIKNNIEKINIKYIGYNENAIDIIKNNIKNIPLESLLRNKNAIYLDIVEDYILKYSNFIKTNKFVKKYKKHIWTGLFENKNAYYIFEKYEDKINWNILLDEYGIERLMINEAMYGFILRNYKKFGWNKLSLCTSPDIIKLLEENINMIDWSILSMNSCDDAIKLLKKYPDKIDYDSLCSNTNFDSFKILYDHIKLNLNDIDIFRINTWLSMCVTQNKNIFIINKNETNKRIDEFISQLK